MAWLSTDTPAAVARYLCPAVLVRRLHVEDEARLLAHPSERERLFGRHHPPSVRRREFRITRNAGSVGLHFHRHAARLSLREHQRGFRQTHGHEWHDAERPDSLAVHVIHIALHDRPLDGEGLSVDRDFEDRRQNWIRLT